jgi:hypothetical protein
MLPLQTGPHGDHCCSALTLLDRQAAAVAGLTCSPSRCARVLLAELRTFDTLVSRLREPIRAREDGAT